MKQPPPNASWNFELPVRLKLAIADANTAFAPLENNTSGTV
jgi:hypothetical protein